MLELMEIEGTRADEWTVGTVWPRSAELEPIPDDLDELEEGIVTLFEHISMQTHRLLLMLAEFDRRRGWERSGHRSAAHWLSERTKIDLGTAREKVRTARALVGLPEISESMAKGELSLCQARALTRVATPDNEGELLEKTKDKPVAQVERIVRRYRAETEDAEAAERRRWESRRFAVFPDGDGMYQVTGKLPPEIGALLMKAIEAVSDALYRQEKPGPLATDEERHEAAAQRRADAVGLLAERAMAAGFGRAGGRAAEARAAEEAAAAGAQEETAAAGRACDCCAPRPVSGTRAERYQIMVHLDAADIATGEPRAHLDDGHGLSCETLRRLACDAALVGVLHGDDGDVLSVGRRTRTIPPALRRALEIRDRGCRFTNCGSRFVDAHHIVHWMDGGETSLANCLLLCLHHHRLVHGGGWTVAWGEGTEAVFTPPGGAR